jgi:hypothetical protein
VVSQWTYAFIWVWLGHRNMCANKDPSGWPGRRECSHIYISTITFPKCVKTVRPGGLAHITYIASHTTLFYTPTHYLAILGEENPWIVGIAFCTSLCVHISSSPTNLQTSFFGLPRINVIVLFICGQYNGHISVFPFCEVWSPPSAVWTLTDLCRGVFTLLVLTRSLQWRRSGEETNTIDRPRPYLNTSPVRRSSFDRKVYRETCFPVSSQNALCSFLACW